MRIRRLIQFFLLYLAFVCSLLFVVQELRKEDSELLGHAWIIFFGVSGFLIGLYLKKHNYNELFKVLLPASVSVLGTFWLLSTGYLDIKAENLRNNISKFEKDTSNLKGQLRLLNRTKDSLLRIKDEEVRKKDSIKKIADTYENKVKSLNNIERELSISLSRNELKVQRNETLESYVNFFQGEKLSSKYDNTENKIICSVFLKIGAEEVIKLGNDKIDLNITIMDSRKQTVKSYNAENKQYEFDLTNFENEIGEDALLYFYWKPRAYYGYRTDETKFWKDRYVYQIKFDKAKHDIFIVD